MNRDVIELATSREIYIESLKPDHVFSDSNQKVIFDYWLQCCSDFEIPPPERIDPLALPPSVLPFLAIEEYDAGIGRFQTRLSGTAYRDAVGYDGTNLRTDEIAGTETAIARLTRLVESRRPYWYAGPCTFSRSPWRPFSVLSLPFGHPGEPVSRVLCVFDFSPDQT